MHRETYYDKRRCRIKLAFNFFCVAMMSISALGILNELNVFGEGDGKVDAVDKIDILYHSLGGVVWTSVCVIGNIAFCQRDRIARARYSDRTCWNLFCPARFDQAEQSQYDQPLTADISVNQT